MPTLEERVAGIREAAVARRPLTGDDAFTLLLHGTLETNWPGDEAWWFHLRPPPAAPRRILVVQLSSVGDVLYVTPSLGPLRRRHPEAHIDLLTEAAPAGLLRGHPALDEVVVYDRAALRRRIEAGDADGALGEMAALAGRLRDAAYDWVVNLHSSPRSAVLAWIAGGAAADGIVLDSCGLPTIRGHAGLHAAAWVRTPAGKAAALDPAWATAWSLGVGAPDEAPSVAVDPAAEARAAALLPAGPLLGIVPGSNFPSRRWPAERFRAAAEAVAGRFGLSPFVVGAPAERDILVRAAPEGAPILDGPLSEVAAAFRRTRLLLTNDTGPVHLAACLGVPAVVVAGPFLSAPYAKGFVLHRPGLPCRPCERADCPAAFGHACMRGVEPDEVAAVAASLLDGSPPPDLSARGVDLMRPRPMRDRAFGFSLEALPPRPLGVASALSALRRHLLLEAWRDMNRSIGVAEKDDAGGLLGFLRDATASGALAEAAGTLAPPDADALRSVARAAAPAETPGLDLGLEERTRRLARRAAARTERLRAALGAAALRRV